MVSQGNHSHPHTMLPTSHIASARNAAEKAVGILAYASPLDNGWYGDIRKRYTDFQVFEVRKDGTVNHLVDYQQPSKPSAHTQRGDDSTNTNPSAADKAPHSGQASPRIKNEISPRPEPAAENEISEEDVKVLEDLLGARAAQELVELDMKIRAKDGSSNGARVSTEPITDRTVRTKVHQEIRRIFSSRIETQVVDIGGIIAATPLQTPKGRSNQSKGSRAHHQSNNWRSGHRGEPRPARKDYPYLHFTLYKENKDTMDAINHIARLLRLKSNNFGFAGTKDRRAVTVQRVSVLHKTKEELNSLNDRLVGIRVGDFSYQKKPMQLGQHGGNDFVITIKNVQLTRGHGFSIEHRLRMTEVCVQTALDNIVRGGFINYFGLQRFGTHTIGTQEVGMKILRGDFIGAVDAILHVDPDLAAVAVTEGSNDGRFHKEEYDRARAIAVWRMTGNAEAAVRILPKRYGAEFNLMRHLGKAPTDHCGALLSITRGLRQLYIHAYQSLIWNFVVTERWARYGSKVVRGDLILVDSEAALAQRQPAEDMCDDIAQSDEEFYQQARQLSEEEAASGRFSIFDVVLPVPGFDVIYPNNDIGDFYAEFMKREENGGLDPYEMRRRQREFSLSGHYRKVISNFQVPPKFAVRPYHNDEEQMHPTDRDLIEHRKKMERQAARTHGVSAAWGHFAQNAASYDAAAAEENRRRRSQSPQDQATGTRINDAWIETSEDGGKRMKVHDVVKQEFVLPHAWNGLDQKENDGSPAKVEDAKPTVKGADPSDAELGSSGPPPLREKPTDDGIKLDTHVDATKDGESKAQTDAEKRQRPPSITHNVDLLRYLHAHLQSSSPPVEGPTPEAKWPQSPNPWTYPTKSNEHASVDPTDSSTGIGHSNPSDAHSVNSTPPRSPVTNIFEDVKHNNDPGHPAINLTKHVDPSALLEDMKIAVVLNFRLSASNYATICIREMMGHHT